MKPSAVGGLVLACCVTWFASAETASAETASAETATAETGRPLVVGRPVERSIGALESHPYRLPRGAGGELRLVVEQAGIDLVAVLRDSAGEELATLNDPLGRFDREVFLLPREAERLDIRPLLGSLEAGRYALSLEPAPAASSALHEAETNLSAAAALRFLGSHEEMAGAAERYSSAAAGFAALGMPRQEARAVLSAANFLRVLGEHAAAHEHYARARDLWQELDEPGFTADCLVGLGQTARELGQPDRARELLQQALALWRRLDRRLEAGSTLSNLGLLAHLGGDLTTAFDAYRAALAAHQEVGWELEVASLRLNIGSVESQLGRAREALEQASRSLALFRRLGERRGELDALNNLAVLHRRMGEPEEALRLYQQARALALELGDRRDEGRALSNQGRVYLELGDLDRAAEHLERALVLRREARDLRGETITRLRLGEVEMRRGRLTGARSHLEAALELARRRQGREEPEILGRLGLLLARLGEPGDRQLFDAARELLASRRDPFGEALLAYHQGMASLAGGRPEEAAGALRAALEQWRQLDDEAGQVLALTALGRGERARGRLEAARDHLLRAVELIESLRTELANPDLRASFTHSRRGAFTLLVEILMEQHASDPEAGFDRSALEISERARARGLLDLLAVAAIDLRSGADPRLDDESRDLVRRLSLLVRRQRLVAEGRQKLAPGDDLTAAIADLRARLDLVEAERHRLAAAGDATTQALSARAMQELLDPGTTLLHYALGESRSFLWVVTATTLASYELPAGRDIEDAARELHLALSRVGGESRQAQGRQAASFAERVLGPARQDLVGDRLAVVADGALHYVPFGVLRLDEEPLIRRFEIVRLPSAAVLALHRRRGETRRTPRTVAVFADPLFAPVDVLPADVLPAEGSAAAGSTSTFGPLPGSRREARAIAEWVAPEHRRLLFGVDASPAAFDEDLARRSIVHFATHGVVDTEHPELSSLVLSQVDASGQRQDGFLRLPDVYALELDAELVVLSGCRTGLGRELRGEGLQGLVSGFFHAGGRRVVASLWSVADQATTRLMQHFYRHLLAEDLSPPAALRQAQLTMVEDRRFRDPYYWGAFELHGDWR